MQATSFAQLEMWAAYYLRRCGLGEEALALYQDFRKFEKNSKAGAIQEIFSKMAGAAKKKSGIPKNLGIEPGIGLEQLTNLTTKSQGNRLCKCLFEVAR